MQKGGGRGKRKLPHLTVKVGKYELGLDAILIALGIVFMLFGKQIQPFLSTAADIPALGFYLVVMGAIVIIFERIK